MAIYDTDGNQLQAAFSKDGSPLANAYDVSGNTVLNDNHITVMSYNVQRWEGLNANATIQNVAFGTDNADIIGVQEWGYNEEGGRVGGQPVRTFLAAKGYDEINVGLGVYNKNALVSKLPLSNVTETVFTSGSESYQKCYITVAGKNIAWINTHLATSSNESRKVAQAQTVFEAAELEPYVIITGDLNTVCKSVNDTEYTTIMKQFVDAGYNSANCTNQFGFLDTWTDGTSLAATWYPCDHIITSANISINTVIVDTTKIDVAEQTGQAIDHLPIVAYLTVN